jgi:low affinity Fe/Cu permease
MIMAKRRGTIIAVVVVLVLMVVVQASRMKGFHSHHRPLVSFSSCF